MKAVEVEIAVAEWLGVGSNGRGKSSNHIVVPNFTGLYLSHEADLFVVTGSGYAWEIEIKVSKSDLKADLKKEHQHMGNIRRLYFAMPWDMYDCAHLVPDRAGILLVGSTGKCGLDRAPRPNMNARKLTPEEIITVGRLASRRIWTLKRKLLEK